MNRVDALAFLTSTSSHERFLAAHALSKLAEHQDISALKLARHKEQDSYVLTRLNSAIEHLERAYEKHSVTTKSPEPEELDKEIMEHAKGQAIEWIAGLLLHEIGSKLGLISLAASREVNSYEESHTKRHVQNLQTIFDAIEQLRKAVNPAQYEQFDLAELIDEISEIENEGNNVEYSLVGIRPMMITSSKQLIQLALCNGIRNAIEAVATLTPLANLSNQPAIVITWGSSDTEYWISVIDDGLGITGFPKSFFEIGKSTKTGHPGFGLAIAKQALDTLGGKVTLAASTGRGAKYEMRWRINK